jgi:methyltransferase FkbM-like protein
MSRCRATWSASARISKALRIGYELQEVAVATRNETVAYTVEPYGRYGGIGVVGDEHISVSARAVAQVLDKVLEREGEIDLLKMDTEGSELDTVAAIRPDQLRRIAADLL